MNILNNSLVKKYFDDCNSCEGHMNCIARRILEAMQVPIKKGERYLLIAHNGAIEMKVGLEWPNLHFDVLRLPDRFQIKLCNCICHQGGVCCECRTEMPIGPVKTVECSHAAFKNEHGIKICDRCGIVL